MVKQLGWRDFHHHDSTLVEFLLCLGTLRPTSPIPLFIDDASSFGGRVDPRKGDEIKIATFEEISDNVKTEDWEG